ncbi:hypothetical protein C366_03267 [Cryptococcus neoformans Tu401-1]|uniref:BZIP domain-containing protein n=1 Tax=Cryptococcus neoformans Tu259-1 TaxID=1230072 RepID=A0A854QEF2_CRYNE|nr:hypothetical protein C365_03422 [Cryptococcus neoformans var. grubii Bt85]OXG17865.1 hypothetical protein C366_03267 [Cryptococcus neoformans var. grubii Tu401-1]OXG21342.1 hypothetical protein C361_03560 [Cryptococcus neoformans var. grubii Tu259-1]OXG81598.1 hypothetical protein C350_03133 [Cryptococcus neoformans var. grubii MW-RSA36]OXL08393.1 hypothetical protein C348_03389 [Cryptococcus neoformans var. grubii Gb118]OXM79730.1 hypothetical protein C364_03235 [Cryptococcus neoformans va
MPPKRPAPSRSHAPNKFPRQASFPAATRSRAIKEISGLSEEEDNINEEMKAKLARKEARTIRNRESAQRSRNQRKAHLAWLESRVLELEAENQVLRGVPSDAEPEAKEGSTVEVIEGSVSSALMASFSTLTTSASESASSSVHPNPTSAAASTWTKRSFHPNPSHSRTRTHSREVSPAQSVLSLATDLGLPTELVNGGAGVRLASVTPPSKGMLSEMGVDDDDDDNGAAHKDRIRVGNFFRTHFGRIPPSSNSFSEEEFQLKQENAHLRERVGLLENLVKQVVILFNLNPHSAPLCIPVSMPSMSTPVPAPLSMLLGTPLPTPRFSLSQLSVPMQTPGLNSMSISIPTPTLPYSTSYGGMQEARTESGIATNRTAVEDFWAQGSTHLGHQPDSGTPRAQPSHSLQLYTSDGRTKHSVHPSHLPSPRPPLSSQVEQHTSQMEQMEQRRECAHLGYVRSTAGATVTSAGLEATLLPLFPPPELKISAIRSDSSSNNNSDTNLNPRSYSNSNAGLPLNSNMHADANATTLQQFHSDTEQNGESASFVSLSQGPMTSPFEISYAMPTTPFRCTSISASLSNPTTTSTSLSTSPFSDPLPTSTCYKDEIQAKQTPVACHSAVVATSCPISFASLSFAPADPQAHVRMRRWHEALQRAKGVWCLLVGGGRQKVW